MYVIYAGSELTDSSLRLVAVFRNFIDVDYKSTHFPFRKLQMSISKIVEFEFI